MYLEFTLHDECNTCTTNPQDDCSYVVNEFTGIEFFHSEISAWSRPWGRSTFAKLAL